jgi:DNA (cytosine-5)-methyltransferase 1
MGRAFEPVLAVDLSPTALAVYQHNFPSADCRLEDVETILGAQEDDATSYKALRERYGPVDLLIGGPPCQGHSDLNNHTRRDDPKNQLYMTMARFAEVLQPKWILIENVPGAQHDSTSVVQRTWRAIQALGYHLQGGVLQGVNIGVPQRRRRYFMLASKKPLPSVESIEEAFARPPRDLAWAISDLVDAPPGPNATFDSAARHHKHNRERIALLHKFDLHDLPNEYRPACHRDKQHSYNSVYGRMFWDQPTQTITTGFGSCGQGRYVHSLLERTLTPHEAARVQFIPDFFEFPETGRRALQSMIGNAVPPRMAYALCLSMMGTS